MARRSSLRASDADRDAVADRLRQASVEGRLEPHELEERLHAALRARTYGQLDRLLIDLPSTARRAGVVPAALVVAIRVAALLAFVAVVVVAVALSAAWWLIWAVVWLSVRAGRGSCSARRPPARLSGRARAAGPPSWR